MISFGSICGILGAAIMAVKISESRNFCDKFIEGYVIDTKFNMIVVHVFYTSNNAIALSLRTIKSITSILQ